MKFIRNKTNQSGFTIIELMIATAVFSVILLTATFAIIQISRTYVKGFVATETQNATRDITDELTQAIQLAPGGSITIPSGPSSGVYWFCINGNRYTYAYGPQPAGSDVFMEDVDLSNCSSPANLTSPTSGSKELLSNHMQLVKNGSTPIISQITDTNGQILYQVSLEVLYGDAGSYNATNSGCNPITDGGTFCSSATVFTTVQQRSTLL